MRTLIKLMAMLALLFPVFAQAVGEPYTQDKLDALNKSGKPALVFIHADWCPTCRAQDAVLEKLLPTAEFKPITTLKVDFDMQQEVVKAFGVRYQSTLIVFKGGKEVARVTGETDPDKLAALLRKAL
ncbi:MAG: thioredoxin family protein [Gammaproteobacteria bacterium]|nr:thioredoxin family protein [Gammaproteobacteria bacterium]MBU1776307.1 thioredoxin family protein [Gammaproteobacteria bacterium]MBU1969398.1 thioredoxin family protein [Gammaproteobacteria bacterium]